MPAVDAVGTGADALDSNAWTPALSGAQIQPRPRLARALHPLYSFPASARPRPGGADGAQDWVAGFCPLKDLIKALADDVSGVAE